jgi:hypothetical protein
MSIVGDPKEEYKDLSDNMRHYGQMRFGQLTIFFAITAGLISAVFNFEHKMPLIPKTMLMVCGLYISIMFFIMEERSSTYWNVFHERAKELEPKLGYKQYQQRPHGQYKYITATYATRAILVGSIILWLAALIFSAPILISIE